MYAGMVQVTLLVCKVWLVGKASTGTLDPPVMDAMHALVCCWKIHQLLIINQHTPIFLGRWQVS